MSARASSTKIKNMQAIIYMGASYVSMVVAQRDEAQKLHMIDQLSQAFDLAKDVFRANKISRQGMDQCVSILKSYLELVEEYKLAGPVDVLLFGSNILVDVENLDTLVNRIHISCGLRLQVMDDGEMTRLLFLQTKHAFQKDADLRKKRVLVLHMGPGNTRAMVVEKGRISYYSCYRVGVARMTESLKLAEGVAVEDERNLIRSQVRGIVEQVAYDCQGSGSTPFDALLFLTPEFKNLPTLGADGKAITVESFAKLSKEVASLSVSKRIEKYGLDYANVFALLPCIVFYHQMAELFKVPQIIVNGEGNKGLFMASLVPTPAQTKELEKEVLHFASLLASRYNVDPQHSKQVSKLANKLFDALVSLHGLNEHDKLLLHTAAILHEIGTYINPKQHHQHSQYIILNSELFGLSRLDVQIVGLLARYHRHGAPSMKKRFYAELEERDRLRVQKLSALLRVADALESAHNSRIGEFEVSITPKRVELIVPKMQDLTIENLALKAKGDLFTDIFGYDIVLRA